MAALGVSPANVHRIKGCRARGSMDDQVQATHNRRCGTPSMRLTETARDEPTDRMRVSHCLLEPHPKEEHMFRPRTLFALVVGMLVIASGTAGAGGWKSSSSISLVVMSGSSGLTAASSPSARYGDEITFAVSSSATERPYVLLNCYQGSSWVYSGQAGFYPSFPSYPTSLMFTLSSSAWAGGPADCKARMGMLNADGTRFRELASTSFHVDG